LFTLYIILKQFETPFLVGIALSWQSFFLLYLDYFIILIKTACRLTYRYNSGS